MLFNIFMQIVFQITHLFQYFTAAETIIHSPLLNFYAENMTKSSSVIVAL